MSERSYQRMEDTHDRLMRLLREHQDALVRRISRGNTSAENISGGYMHVAGQVVGLDVAIDIVRNCLFGEPMVDERESVVSAYEL